MSMAHGLELRFPLLDVDLIRTVLATPQSLKRSGRLRPGKPALTNAVARFPSDLVSSRKQGFTIPLKKWIQTELKDDIQPTILELSEKHGFNESAVRSVWDFFQKSGRGEAWLRVWVLYSLARWMRVNKN